MLLSAYIVPHPPIIIPEIGKEETRHIQTTTHAYQRIAKEIATLQPETIVIISSHAPSYQDYIHISPGSKATGDFGRFHHPECRIEANYDEVLVDQICALARKNHLDAGKRGDQTPTLDHGTMIPLYFIYQEYQDFQVVRISVSGLSAETHDQIGQCIVAAAEDLKRDIIVIASGDLSHRLSSDSPYGYAKEGADFDAFATKAMIENDLDAFAHVPENLAKQSAQCGLPVFQILNGVLRDSGFFSEACTYEHPFGIGYATCMFHETEEDPYIALARDAIRWYLEHETMLKMPESLPPELKKRGSVFVSLYKGYNLRGCIGSIQPVYPTIAQEILQHAVAAAVHDSRFSPLSAKELPQISIQIDVISDLEPVFFPDELDVERYGLIVSSGGKRGVLLPHIKGIDTVEQQLQIALQKAGIDPSEFYTMERFTVEHHASH